MAGRAVERDVAERARGVVAHDRLDPRVGGPHVRGAAVVEHDDEVLGAGGVGHPGDRAA